MIWRSNYFYGNKVSDYGIKHHRVDYAALAKSFDVVLNNNIMEATSEIGYWDIVSGSIEYHEDLEGNRYTAYEADELLEELREKQLDIDEDSDEHAEIEREIETLEHEYYHDIFQYYIIDDRGARILEEVGEIVWYNEELDMYIWGVAHYGTAWDYVLTDIVIETETED